MTSPAELRTALEAAAAELPDTSSAPAALAAVEWKRAGVGFALLQGASVDLRVGALIAAAAVRTPDTTPSDRGPDWVAFAPAALDDHALDRLVAWFAAAHRRAAPGA
ncbi:MAG: hypothetical protein EPO36_04405 [Chloroflexota bacterium]|nr:MAG: hypothetical protein EPO36_04405 [Chloroflexota bacterium]